MGSHLGVSLPVVVLLAAVLAGCGRAESPATVSKNVAAAQQRAESKADRASDKESRDVAKAQQHVEDKVVDRNNVAAADSYKVNVAQADGDHDVAIQKCKALAGDAQDRCKQQADANYDAAKANAKATEVSRQR
jgi:hypothetical protein